MIQNDLGKLFETILSKKYTVFRSELPPEDQPGPYVQIGYGFNECTPGKGFARGRTELSIHVWHDLTDEPDITHSMMDEILKVAQSLSEVGTAQVILTQAEATSTKDTTTSTTWDHGALVLTYTYVG